MVNERVKRSRNEIPTIDVNLVTITTASGKEFGFDTANQIEVEVQTEEEEAVKLIIKGKIKAQKPKQTTITGHEITLHDNLFNPQLVKVLQGGKVLYWKDAEHTGVTEDETSFGVAKYTPPVAGSDEVGEVFTLNAYSAIYNGAGLITGYEKTMYPNCQGSPVAFNSEDGTFRAPEYTISSAPNVGQAPYEMDWIENLPVLVDADDTVGEYTITYMLDGGTNPVINPSSYTGEENVALVNPTKSGYTFEGWYLSSTFDASDKVEEIEAGSTGNITLWAKWASI